MLMGYARTSTVKQNGGLVAQLELLEKAGVDRDNVFQEQVSSVQERIQLEAALHCACQLVPSTWEWLKQCRHIHAVQLKVGGVAPPGLAVDRR